MDPTAVEFTASSDHDALGPNGQPLVFRYELLLYAAGSSSPTTVASLGKPSPDDGGTIRMALASIFNPMPAGGIIYEARIAAVGAGGSGISDPSNSFSFPVTCTYAVTPSNRSVGVGGGSVSFSVAAPPGCAWSSSTNEGWIGMAGSGAGIGSGSVTFVVGKQSELRFAQRVGHDRRSQRLCKSIGDRVLVYGVADVENRRADRWRGVDLGRGSWQLPMVSIGTSSVDQHHRRRERQRRRHGHIRHSREQRPGSALDRDHGRWPFDRRRSGSSHAAGRSEWNEDYW